MAPFITEYPQFFTATNLEWKKLLKPDKYKDMIISSLRFLVKGAFQIVAALASLAEFRRQAACGELNIVVGISGQTLKSKGVGLGKRQLYITLY